MDELPVDAPRPGGEEVEVLIEAKPEAVAVAVGLVPGEEVEVPIQAKKDKKPKKAKKPKKEAKSLSSSGSSVELHEMKETKEEHDHKGKEKAKEAEDEHHHHHQQQHEELEKEELPETKRMRLKEKVRSLHGSSQAMGVAIKKTIRFTVASASMFGADDEIEEEYYTDYAVYHTSSKALSANIAITDHSPLIFHRIRTLAEVTPEEYLEAWLDTPLDDSKLFRKAASGKSGSLFLFSANKRFIIKTLPAKEGRTLIRMLPAYYQHLVDNPQSLLCRLLGYYAIEVGGHTHYLVMQRNIFWNAPLFSEIYDLKGSTRGRKSTEQEKSRGGDKCVLKDLDFIEVKRRISLPPPIKEKFLAAIKSDSEFLVPSNLIDYSLLVGIHKKEQNEEGHTDGSHDDKTKKKHKKHKKKKEKKHSHHHHEKDKKKDDADIFLWRGGVESADGSEVYYMGIIDFLSPYATKKKMAHLFKRGVLLNEAATLSLVPADFYASRFQLFLTSGVE